MNSSSSNRARLSAACFTVLCVPAASLAANLEAPGVPNFHQVSQQVYRGAQPTDEGFASLSKLGIKTVIDLRELGEHSQADEKRIVEAGGMHYISVPMKGMSTPTNEQVSKVIGLFEDSSAGPVFVHCRRGADRTGGVIAVYRIEHDHWESGRALDEARSLGMSWFQKAIQHYVRNFQSAQLAIAAAPSTPAATPVVTEAAVEPVAALPTAPTAQ
jgi:protein tyrosine/serine phosphatase